MQQAILSQFNRNTTAEEVISGVDLSGRLAVITGGSTGLGLETARVFVMAGADVLIGARRESKLQEAAEVLRAAGTANVYTQPLDLMEPESVKQFADAALKLDRPIDLLVNNAGIMACPLARNSLGIESQFATNYVGHALLTSLLSSALKAAEKSRMISLASLGHHLSPVVFEDINYESREYVPLEAYGQTKTANVLLAVKAHKHLAQHGVTAIAVHPGSILTELNRYTPKEKIEDAKAKGRFKTVEAGSATSVWAATEPELEGKGPIYVEDCQVAPPVDEPNLNFGVLPYALDADLADRLWAEAEKMLGQSLPL